MNKNLILLIAGSIIAGIIVLSQSIYIVDETQQVVITQFGKPIGDAVTTPGLKKSKLLSFRKQIFLKNDIWNGTVIPTKFRQKRKIYFC